MAPRTPVRPLTGYTYCVSDLHIQPKSANGLFDRLFTDAKAQVLCSLAKQVANSAGRSSLILAGDTFDLTGMTPPANGLDEFFTAVLGERHGIAIPRPKSAEEYLQQIADSYPELMRALGKITERHDLVFLEGNHDHALSTPSAKAKLASLMGVLVDEIHFEPDYQVGDYFLVHGHEYDESCKTGDGRHPNRGAVIASALYHAVMPALVKLDVGLDFVSAIPAVRPEEKIVEGLLEILDERQRETFLRAFVKLLVVNDYWPAVPDCINEIVGEIAGTVVTPETVLKEMADDTAMGGILRAEAYELLLGEGQDPNGWRVAVMGHTHDCDVDLPDYVNLGSWIDAISGLTEEARGNARCELPVLRIDSDKKKSVLFDARALAENGELDACRQLWARPSELSRMQLAWSPDFTDPTVSHKDARGFSYVETSPLWKQTCSGFPCFEAIQWPDYASKVIDVVIDGKPIVIQLWKGWCQQFLGRSDFPGGIGAEVGIYRRVEGRRLPDDLRIASPVYRRLLQKAAALGGDHIWWPYPEFNAKLELSFVNPLNQEVVFKAGPQISYWLNCWMSEGCYFKYRARERTPRLAVGYRLDFTVNGQQFSW